MPQIPNPELNMPQISNLTGGAPITEDSAPKVGSAMVPQDPSGQQAAHKAGIHTAIKILEEGIPIWGFNTPEGEALQKALKLLTNTFGEEPGSDISKAQIQNLMKILQGEQGPIPLGGAGAAPEAPQGMPPELLQLMGGQQ